MEVLTEILEWSQNRPAWQREALRRLVVNGSLDQSDIESLLVHCKSAHGLAEKLEFKPLTEEHIPAQSSSADAVTLKNLKHKKGVNALAENQTINFGKSLTVVYGQNAAGKSGYTRVLKKACRARGSEDILGNVLSEKIPSKPSASLTYSIRENDSTWDWTDTDTQEPALGNVSVFDRHCATVYLSQRTDVAFRPFGLDVFDKLAACCEKLKIALEKEKQELNKNQFEIDIPVDTKAYGLVTNLNALTDIDSIKLFAELSTEESDKLKKIKVQLQELSADDNAKNRKELDLKLKRIQSFRINLFELMKVWSHENLSSVTKSRETISANEKKVKQIEGAFLKHANLTGTGNDEWFNMWRSASEYSETAYPKKDFPFIGKDAHCVLCQQALEKEAIERFSSFATFVNSDIQSELENARGELQSQISEMESALQYSLSDSDILQEIEIENDKLGKQLRVLIKAAEAGVDLILKNSKTTKKTEVNAESFDPAGIIVVEEDLKERIKNLTSGVDKGQLKKMQSELNELEGKKALKARMPNIVKEVERQKRIAVYTMCLGDVGTAAITKKSTEITKKVVTEHLINSFHEELKKLGFDHLEIDLQPSGATKGALYHKLVITRATHVEVQNVVSEGEARALSIAAFFAELSTASNQSGILFDDPVSSLDHVWRERIAGRLVEEAKTRQVIIFTHDIVFLTALSRIAEEKNVDIQNQYIHREHEGAGVSSPDLPWVAMRVGARIGVLKNQLQQVVKIEKNSGQEEYEKEASLLYGKLRETWERALEEILIGGIVERYRPSIQTQHVKILATISDDDCTTLHAGMTKSSRWLPGHDNSGAEGSPFPNSTELQKDIESLENWVKEIKKKRQS